MMHHDRDFHSTKQEVAGFLTFFSRELTDPFNVKLNTPEMKMLTRFTRKLADPDVSEVEMFVWTISNLRQFPEDLRQPLFDHFFVEGAVETAKLCNENGLDKKHWYFKAIDALED